MTTENTNQTAPVTTPASPAPATVDKHVVKWNDIDVTLTRVSTAEREGKTSVAYWGIDYNQFTVTKEVTDDKGVKSTVTDEAATLARLAKLHSFDRLVDMVSAKSNANIKATQLNAGKDTYTMAKKSQYAIDYINADFGLHSKGGGGLAVAFRALKDINTRQAEINRRMFEIGAKLIDTNVSATDKVALVQEMTALSTEVATIGKK